MICDFDVELIRQEACESSIRYKENRSLGPLDGVPCVVKDQIDVKGLCVKILLLFFHYQ